MNKMSKLFTVLFLAVLFLTIGGVDNVFASELSDLQSQMLEDAKQRQEDAQNSDFRQVVSDGINGVNFAQKIVFPILIFALVILAFFARKFFNKTNKAKSKKENDNKIEKLTRSMATLEDAIARLDVDLNKTQGQLIQEKASKAPNKELIANLESRIILIETQLTKKQSDLVDVKVALGL